MWRCTNCSFGWACPGSHNRHSEASTPHLLIQKPRLKWIRHSFLTRCFFEQFTVYHALSAFRKSLNDLSGFAPNIIVVKLIFKMIIEVSSFTIFLSMKNWNCLFETFKRRIFPVQVKEIRFPDRIVFKSAFRANSHGFTFPTNLSVHFCLFLQTHAFHDLCQRIVETSSLHPHLLQVRFIVCSSFLVAHSHIVTRQPRRESRTTWGRSRAIRERFELITLPSCLPRCDLLFLHFEEASDHDVYVCLQRLPTQKSFPCLLWYLLTMVVMKTNRQLTTDSVTVSFSVDFG